MIKLEEIRRPVAAELQEYETLLRTALSSEKRLTSQMLDHVMASRGKGVRPLMVLLGAAMHGRAADGFVPAMLVEMLHTATLVHDDVIDQSPTRRGRPSVNALWDSRRAVLLGDIILAKSFCMGMESGLYDVVTYITGCMTALCEGELLQSDMIASPEMTREIYEEIIYKKTATLIGTCCGVGALAAGASAEQAALMKRAGDAAGMAFQIKDDILDFSVNDTGKPHLEDLREGKITLPLLCILESGDSEELGVGSEKSRVGSQRHPERSEGSHVQVGSEEAGERSFCHCEEPVRATRQSQSGHGRDCHVALRALRNDNAERSEPSKEQIFSLLRAGDAETLAEIVRAGGGLEKAAEVMDDYIAQAVDLLHSACPPSPFRQSLESLFHFIADRTL